MPDNRGLLSYCIGNLHKYLHGTLHVNTEQEVYFKEATAHLEVKMLEHGSHFDVQQSGIHVKYLKLDESKYCFSSLISLVDDVAPVMDSSCSTSRKVPSVSCGWSTANAHEYKNNCTTMVGSISPFLLEGGINTLDYKKKLKVSWLVGDVIKMFSPCGRNPSPFFHSDKNIRAERVKLAYKFLMSLCDEQHAQNTKDYFLAEGVSFIFNNFISFHMDTMNDPTPGMNETLIAMSPLPRT
jgi:hypothetical protein